MKRLVRRLTLSGLASAIGVGGLALAFNLFSAQDQACGAPFFQPRISDLCGALGLGNRATKAERVAWEGRQPGSCEALRTHIDRFPEGAYHDKAADMLAARRITKTEIWIPSTRRLSQFTPQGDKSFKTKAAAQEGALVHAQGAAERLCKGFVATTSFRLKSAKPIPQSWNCGPSGGGIVCGFEGEAVCELEERRIQETESCGS